MTPEERARERARKVLEAQSIDETGKGTLVDAIAAAILEAEKRGYERGLERAAEIAEAERERCANEAQRSPLDLHGRWRRTEWAATAFIIRDKIRAELEGK